MRALTWLLGCFVLGLAFEYTSSAGTHWAWVWISATVLWVLAGVGIALVRLVQLTTGKIGAGAFGLRSKPSGGAPAPSKEE